MNLLENRQIRRLICNVLLSQKRFTDADMAKGAVTEEMLQEFAESIPEETIKYWYVNGTIELDTFEALLEYKFGLAETLT